MSQHKIDELLDYTIAQRKEIEELKREVKRLKSKLTQLSNDTK